MWMSFLVTISLYIFLHHSAMVKLESIHVFGVALTHMITWLCARGGCTTRDSWALLLLLLFSFMMCENDRIHCGRIFVLLSSVFTRIWKHLTSKTHVTYILSSVCLRIGLFSPLSVMKYMGLCVFSLPISLIKNCESICTLSYYNHHQFWTMTNLPLFRFRSWNNGMRSVFFNIPWF